jgi:hypothetical protein
MAAERGGGGDGVRRGRDGVRRGRGGECEAASGAGQLSVLWTPWRTAAVLATLPRAWRILGAEPLSRSFLI